MPRYLGSTSIDVTTDPRFKNWTTKDFAMEFITRYGQIDGEHHKSWVLDQVSRILLGSPIEANQRCWARPDESIITEVDFTVGSSESYRKWRRGFVEYDSDDGSEIDDYECGTAP